MKSLKVKDLIPYNCYRIIILDEGYYIDIVYMQRVGDTETLIKIMIIEDTDQAMLAYDKGYVMEWYLSTLAETIVSIPNNEAAIELAKMIDL